MLSVIVPVFNSAETLSQCLSSILIQSYKDIDAWNDTPVLKEESFNLLQDVISMAGELEKKAPYSEIVNNKYASEAVNFY